MKFKKPLSLLLAAVLLCFTVPLLETPALAADKEIHEVATAGVYKWITITAGEGGAVTEVEQTGGVLPPVCRWARMRMCPAFSARRQLPALTY